jgi:hypothetical protein
LEDGSPQGDDYMQLLPPKRHEIIVSGDGGNTVTFDNKQIGMKGISKTFSQQNIGTLGAEQESFCEDVLNSL